MDGKDLRVSGEADLERASDDALVRRARAGERGAFDVLVGRYAKPLLNFFLRAIGNRARAEDLWQDTFCTAWDRLSTFDTDRRLRPWLYGIAMNLLRNAWRASNKLPKQLEDGADRPDRRPGPDAQAADREVGQIIWEGVRDLSDEQRLVFVLRIYHGLDYAEISQILECPEGTAKSRMHFAAEAIRKHLEKRGVRPEAGKPPPAGGSGN